MVPHSPIPYQPTVSFVGWRRRTELELSCVLCRVGVRDEALGYRAEVGMFPLILPVLSRDNYNTPYSNPY